uniref:Uncharacterized protein n=1 Tax=viral metagenome TaxID=1070528 RepID=A0A6C0BJR8_9ZZZZ
MNIGGQLNPYIIEHLKQNETNALMIKYASQLLVDGIYQEGKAVKEEVFDSVRIWCSENHVQFMIREFYGGFDEDREMIERLPAFNIYFKDEYEKTFYPEDSVEEEILKILPKKEKKENGKNEKSKKIEIGKKSWKQFFGKMFKKKLLTSS